MSFKRLSYALMASLLPFSYAVSAAPINDLFTDATPITALPYSVEQQVEEATNSTNEVIPSCAAKAANSVWYEYTATEAQTILFNTKDSSYDTVLSIWQGDTHPLTEVACNDDSLLNDDFAQVTLNTTVNQRYFINIAGFDGGSGDLKLNAIPVNFLVNDDLANATSISQTTVQIIQTTQGSSNEPDEVAASCGGNSGASVWYRYTATENETVVFDTLGSDFDTVLSLWSGSQHPLTEVACSDEINGDPQSLLSLEAEKDNSYLIRVSGNISAGQPVPETGTLLFNISSPPSNDLPENALEITALPYSHSQLTTSAGHEDQEESASCAPSGASVWYRYTATADQSVSFSTDKSNFDTVMSVWKNEDNELTEVACNDDGISDDVQTQISQTTLSVTKDSTYLISVAGVSEATGALVFSAKVVENDLTITSQPQSQTITVDDTVTLTVEASGTDPKEYQWYQGSTGDTNQPVGSNSASFTSDALNSSTEFWVSVKNITGEVNSDTAIITVETTTTDSNGTGISAAGITLATTANFTAELVKDGVLLDGTASTEDDISLTMSVSVDSAHLGETAELILVAGYQFDQESDLLFFMRGEEINQWNLWSGVMGDLTAVNTIDSLVDSFDVTIHTGNLPFGELLIYAGYRLTNGSVFFNGVPVAIAVTD